MEVKERSEHNQPESAALSQPVTADQRRSEGNLHFSHECGTQELREEEIAAVSHFKSGKVMKLDEGSHKNQEEEEWKQSAAFTKP